MLKDINDSPKHAKQLISILNDVPSKINLIPFNPFPGANYECSDRTTIDSFRKRLHNAGIVTVTRKTRGDDIAAACGQLVGEVQAKSARKNAARPITFHENRPEAAI